jgi:putative transposase
VLGESAVHAKLPGLPPRTPTRHGRDRTGRQRFRCTGCRRTFTIDSATAFCGYHWPADIILTAVRWYLSHPLSSTSVMTLLAERGVDVSPRTVLRGVQTCGPRLVAEVHEHRRRPGTTWYVNAVVFFRKKAGQPAGEKRYRYRAIDEQGQVLDVLFRDHRDSESATAFFRRTLGRTGTAPTTVVSDHHQPSAAVPAVVPDAQHVRTGMHRARGETTKPIARSHIPTRDRLRSSRGLKTLTTGQYFFERFEVVHALRRGHVHLEPLVPGFPPTGATPHQRARAVVTALQAVGARLTRAVEPLHMGVQPLPRPGQRAQRTATRPCDLWGPETRSARGQGR